MPEHPEHSEKRISAYIQHLEQCNAPEGLIEDFLELIRLDNNMSEAASLGISTKEHHLESLDRLLVDSCRNFNFPSPFDTKAESAAFPPAHLTGGPDWKKDGRLYGNDFKPEVEQAYRRGFVQGFEDALAIANVPKKGSVAKRLQALWNWRQSLVWFGASEPGTAEPFGLNIGLRKSMSKKLRWKVLERDGNKCIACGLKPSDGIRLHVDHILSIYHGGTNNLDNLQTLCEHCNLGKGKD